MSHRYDPREHWRWEEDQRQREERGLVEGEGFERDAGDPRWGTGGMRVEEGPYRGVRSERDWPAGGRGPRVPPIRMRPYPEYESARGPYVGVGPRGYRRTDERIREDVCERFAEHGQLDASDIEVSVREGEVLLNGTVATRAQKRLAEDIADGVSGVVEVHNHLRVQRTAGGEAPSPHGTPVPRVANGRPGAASPTKER